MANKKISELAVRTPSLTDLMLVGDPSTGYSYKATISSLSTLLEANIALDDLNDVTITSPTAGQVLSYNGTAWVNDTNGITGTGTTNYVPKFTSSSAIGNSQIFDNGTNVGIGTATPSVKFESNGRIRTTRTGDATQYIDFNTDAGGHYILANGASKNLFITNASSGFSGIIFNAAVASDYVFQQAGTGKMTLSSDGILYLPSSSSVVSEVGILSGSGGVGTDKAGHELRLRGGYSTGSGSGGPITFYTSPAGSSGSSPNTLIEQMRLNSSGNLGLGTSSPAFKLDVLSSTTTIAKFTGATNAYVDFTDGIVNTRLQNSGGLLFGTTTNHDLTLRTNAASRLTITSGGNVLVGTTSASTTGVYGTPQLSVESNTFASSQIMSHHNTSGNFSILGIGKSRGTGAAPTIVADGEVVGAIYFFGYDGASYRPTSAITSIVNGTPGTADMPGALIFNTTADGASSISERARIDASGNLGLGVTPSAWASPTYRAFQIGSTAALFSASGQVLLDANSYVSSAFLDIYSSTGFATRYQQISGQHRWFTAPSGTAGNTISWSQVMTLDASGRLGIGVTNPAQALHISTSTTYQGILINGNQAPSVGFNISNNTTPLYKIGISGNSATAFSISSGAAATDLVYITSGGNVGIGTTNPQSRIHALLSGNAAAGPTGTVAVFQNSTPASNSYITLLGAFDSESGIVFTDESVAFRGKIGYNNSTEFMYFQTDGSERMRLNSSGNLGLGVTPSAWGATWRALELEYSSAGTAIASLYPAIMANTYNTGGGFFYKVTGQASYYQQIIGQHRWHTAPSGTAGNAITFTQAMTLDASGRLGIGTTSPSYKLDVYDAVNSAYLNVTGGGTTSMLFGSSSSGLGILGTTSNHGLDIRTNNTSVIRVTTGGNVGIGTTTPTAYSGYTTLAINNATNGGVIDFMRNGVVDVQLANNPTTASFEISSFTVGRSINFLTNGGFERMRITSGGELLINTTSDAGDFKLQVNGAYYGNGRVYLSGTGFNVTGAPSLYLENTTATTGRTYALNSYNSGGFQVFDVTNANATVFLINSSGNAEIPTGSIKTAAPSGGTAKPWKLGTVKTDTVVLDDGAWVEVEIDGVAYKLALAVIP